MQPFERLLIAPLQVVDQQEQRLRRSEHGLRKGLEESEPLTEFGQRLRPPQLGPLGQQLRHEACDFRQPHVVQPAP